MTASPTDRGADPASAVGPRPPTSIAVINYNGRDQLPSTLEAIDELRDRRTEVMLVDDESDDGSPEWVARHCPFVRIVRMGRHMGRPAPLRNRALREAEHMYVLLLDNDVVLRPGCLERLLSVLRSCRDALCCTPRLVYRSDPDRIYQDGGGLHYLAVSTSLARGERHSERPPGPPRRAVGCGNMLVDRAVVRETGGFDEGYLFGWGEDGELHARVRLYGYRVLHVPDAVCEHEASRHGTRRALAQLYNRYRLIATIYADRTLLLLAPALFAFEVGVTLVATYRGFLGDRMRAVRRAAADLPEFFARRSEIQDRRVVPDSEILSGDRLMRPETLESGLLMSRIVGAVSLVSRLYWRCVRRWL